MLTTDSECLRAINALTQETSPKQFAEFTGCTREQAIDIYSYLVAMTVEEMVEGKQHEHT